MTVSFLSYRIAEEIASGEKFTIERFYKGGDVNDYISFCHYNFFYHYPEFGTKFKGDKESSFHQVEICCHICKMKPERNYAGIGTIYLLHNGASFPEVIIADRIPGKKKIEFEYKAVPNAPPYEAHMICLCRNCIKGYFPFDRHYNNEVNKKEMVSNKEAFARIKGIFNSLSPDNFKPSEMIIKPGEKLLKSYQIYDTGKIKNPDRLYHFGLSKNKDHCNILIQGAQTNKGRWLMGYMYATGEENSYCYIPDIMIYRNLATLVIYDSKEAAIICAMKQIIIACDKDTSPKAPHLKKQLEEDMSKLILTTI